MILKAIGRSVGLLSIVAVLLLPFILIGELSSRVDDNSGRIASQGSLVLGLVEDSLVDQTWPGAENALRLQNGLWCGSGWVVSCEPNEFGYRILVVTAAHVAEDDPSVPQDVFDEYGHAWTATGGLVGGKYLASHPQRDVAIIEFYSLTPVEALPFSTYVPRYGEEIAHSGYPICDGILRTSSGLACDPGIATFHAAPGCSGGPVFLPDGTVIGILVSGLGTGFDVLTFTGRYVPVSTFEDWLISFL